jgi:hypothetical protein
MLDAKEIGMDAQTRKNMIDSYGAAYDVLTAAVRRYPPEMWQFRPGADSWTIHEIIVHIADSEVNSYVRCRRLLAEPGSAVLGYDEMAWARELAYHAQDPQDAIELFRLLRRITHRLIQDQPAEVWAHIIHHSENGRMTMEDWLNVYERHIPDHVAQMDGILEIWISEQI